MCTTSWLSYLQGGVIISSRRDMETHHSPSTLLQLCPAFLAGTAKQQKGSKAQDRYRRQGRGHWEQLKNLALTLWDPGRHGVAWSCWGTWSLVQGIWEMMAAEAPAGLSFQPWGHQCYRSPEQSCLCEAAMGCSSLCTASGSGATGWSPLFWPTQTQAAGYSASLPVCLINWCDFLNNKSA